jgi:hypothetical protein
VGLLPRWVFEFIPRNMPNFVEEAYSLEATSLNLFLTLLYFTQEVSILGR